MRFPRFGRDSSALQKSGRGLGTGVGQGITAHQDGGGGLASSAETDGFSRSELIRNVMVKSSLPSSKTKGAKGGEASSRHG